VVQELRLDDPQFVTSGLQHHLSLLLSNYRRKALLALPDPEHLVEVIESAAQAGTPECL
jgi:hypothetical protein